MNAMTDPRLEGFHPIHELMHRIKASGNEWPKVRLAFRDTDLILSVAGDRSRNPGAVNLTDGGGYGNNRYFGRIYGSGKLEMAPAARKLEPEDKAALWSILSRMRNGEAEEVFAEHGHRFGTCAMCGRELTNDESIRLGIGPVCRKRAFA